MRKQQRGGVGGDSWFDIAVEEGSRVGDSCYGTLVVDVSFRGIKRRGEDRLCTSIST
jgi:hypothetical protein